MLSGFLKRVKDALTPVDFADGSVMEYDQQEPKLSQMEEKIYNMRERMAAIIVVNGDVSDVVKEMVESISDDFSKKYLFLDVKRLIGHNSRSVKNLYTIVSGLSMISKYAQHLLKNKNQCIKSIPMNNPHLIDKVKPMKGYETVMRQLGYSHQTDASLAFPPDTQPDECVIINLLIDMLVLKAEMKYYLSGSHQYPEQIESLIPGSTLDEFHSTDDAGSNILEESLMIDITKGTNLLNSPCHQNSDASGSGAAYLSARSQLSYNDSQEMIIKSVNMEHNTSSKETDVCLIEEEARKVKKRSEQLVTMQDMVEESTGLETTSLKTPLLSSGFIISCSLCDEDAQCICKICHNKVLCENCEKQWHGHPTRQNHQTVKISDLDPITVASMQNNIIEGPYGIIQTENPAAILGKKMQAAADKAKMEDQVRSSSSELGDQQGGNMPDLGSLMSGNVEEFSKDGNGNNNRAANNSCRAQHSPQQNRSKLWTQGLIQDTTPTKTKPADVSRLQEFIDPSAQLQQGHGQELQQQHQHPKYDIDNLQQIKTNAQVSVPTSMYSTVPTTTPPPHHQFATTGAGIIEQQRVYNALQQQSYQHSPGHAPFIPRQNHGYSPESGQVPYMTQQPHLVVGHPTAYYSMIPDSFPTHTYQHMGHGTISGSVSDHHIPPSLNTHPSDKEQTFVQYSTKGGMQFPFPHVIPNLHPPRQSHTYPQLSTQVSGSPVDKTYQNHPLDRSVSNTSSNSEFPNAALKIINRIKSLTPASQKHACNYKILELNEDLKEIQTEIDELLMEDENENNMLEIKVKTLKKKEWLKIRKELEKFLLEIEAEATTTAAMRKCDKDEEIYYPPSTGLPEQSQESKKKRRSPTKEMEIPKVERWSPSKNNQIFDSGASTVSTNVDEKEKDKNFKIFIPNLIPEDSISTNCSSNEPSSDNTPPPNDFKINLKEDTELSNLKWYCEHCTFLNDAISHACFVCYKTTKVKTFETENGERFEPAATKVIKREKKGLIQNLQEEEEKMMADKKKANDDFLNKLNPGSSAAKAQDEGLTGSHAAIAKSTATARSPHAKANQDSINSNSALEKLRQLESCKIQQQEGEKVLEILREVDIAGYNLDTVAIALSFYDPRTMTVLDWLNINWRKNLLKIMEEVKEIGNGKDQNDVGELSVVEAESACKECHGNLKDAVEVCVKKRESLFQNLNSCNTYAREEILQVMFTQEGDQEKCQEELIRSNLEAFVERIWSKGETLDNLLYPAQGFRGPDICNSISSSALGLDNFQKMIMDKNVDKDRRIRMIWIEGKLVSWGRGQLVIEILDENQLKNAMLDDVVEAVRNCNGRKGALAYLQQECETCFDTFPMGKIQSLSVCQCKLCKECLITNFEVAIKEKHVRHWTCPMCKLPDMNDMDSSTDYLNILQMLLNPVLDQELMLLYDEKVRDFSLQKDPFFRWCAHCGNGFLAANHRPGTAMSCRECKKKTCFTCKRMWEPQHDGMTCEQFEQWKIDNDPSNQAIGLARHLEENGIDCPNCKMRFALAKGGCMHFRCPECAHEFCSGCYESFHQKGMCKKLKSCKGLGLHCHHPRDCFSYLRDNTVEELQKLLETHKVAFNIQVPEDQEDKKHCPVMEQKDEGVTKKDVKCGINVELNMAGLCKKHYKEYLTGLINRHALDPAILMETEKLVNLLRRHEFDLMSRDPMDSDVEYKGKLMKMVQEKIPLKRTHLAAT